MGKILTILVWLFLGVCYWWMHADCCSTGTSHIDDEVAAIQPDDQEAEVPATTKVFGPLTFQLNSPDVQTNESSESYLKSVVQKAKEGEFLHIIGYYQSDETNNTEFDNLGLARASLVRNILAGYVDTAGMTIEGLLKEDLETSADGYFDEVDFSMKVRTKKIKEINDRTLIYFPYNSSIRLDDSEIEAYLNDVVERVLETGETITLTGHTDSFGDAGYNYQLGLNRANVIARYLSRKGVPKSQIVVDSKGEVSPIAPNNTKEGRSKNRRTELIIK